tara:strand:- start:234 stop:449 length:216 start_codon:yes stop_codon:yes gene_type:complete
MVSNFNGGPTFAESFDKGYGLYSGPIHPDSTNVIKIKNIELLYFISNTRDYLLFIYIYKLINIEINNIEIN